MDLLQEIKRRKAERKKRNAALGGCIENPLPRWEKVWAEVSEMIRVYCISKRMTFSELIEECREIDPGGVNNFYRLWDLVDCDAFGRWVDNRLTEQDLRAFFVLVDEWKDAVRSLLSLHEQGSGSVHNRGVFDK